MPHKADSENDVILEIHHVGKYEEFSCNNNSLPCYNENKDCEEATLEQSAAKHQETENQENDEDDTTKSEQVISQDAKKFTAGLQFCFTQEGHEGSPISALETCADFVQLQSIKRTWQGTLNQFLQHHC
jgi:FKBP-type peptidyl-prolyl cis-trans isomerase